MIKLARSVPGIPISHNELDADPWAFNVTNGTIDLRTGELGPHDPAQLLTQLAPVEYRPEAQAPLFQKFLKRILPDEPVRRYVQRFAGHSLTGVTSEQVLEIWWGDGCNGKTTLIEILPRVARRLCRRVPAGTACCATFRATSYPRASLFGARLATCSELSEHVTLDEARIKRSLVGTRSKHAASAKTSGNSSRHTNSSSRPTTCRWTGRRRRILAAIRLVPFTVKIPAEEVDRDLANKIITKELSGVLAWALAGCAEWQTGGLKPPDAVQCFANSYFISFCPAPSPRWRQVQQSGDPFAQAA